MPAFPATGCTVAGHRLNGRGWVRISDLSRVRHRPSRPTIAVFCLQNPLIHAYSLSLNAARLGSLGSGLRQGMRQRRDTHGGLREPRTAPNRSAKESEWRRRESVYGTEGHRFESCRARLVAGISPGLSVDIEMWICAHRYRHFSSLRPVWAPVTFAPTAVMARTDRRWDLTAVALAAFVLALPAHIRLRLTTRGDDRWHAGRYVA
jgi:hypothetical protein